jgi:predicted phage baseplate assembly protein
MDDNQVAHLRFGDGLLGAAPQAGETFFASYRVASGSLGNVGRETIKHLVYLDEVVTGLNLTIDNPLPASSGTDPEPVEEVKMFAPGAFLNQLDRAITADDYAQLAERNPLVQRAAASLVWTGSRYEAQVAIDPLGTDAPDPQLLKRVEQYLYPFRRVGHDLRVLQAQYVPLDLSLSVQVAPGYLADHVKRALLDALGNRKIPGGKVGFFYPDNLTFGQSIYASQIISAAQMQDGVVSVTITRLERLLEEERHGATDGVLAIGPLEIAQLDNDADHPERGRIRLQMGGGR